MEKCALKQYQKAKIRSTIAKVQHNYNLNSAKPLLKAKNNKTVAKSTCSRAVVKS